MNAKKLLFSFVAFVLSSSSLSAQNSIFSPVNPELGQEIRTQHADSFRNLSVFAENPTALLQWNKSIGKSYDDITQTFAITIPLPSGENITFNISSSHTLSASFRNTYPNVYNFKGTSSDKKYSIRLTTSNETVYAKITHKPTRQEWVLHPEQIGSDNYIIFDKADDLRKANFNCEAGNNLPDEISETANDNLSTFSEVGIGALRTYRIMVALTDGFTTMLGSVPNSVVAMANTIDRVSEIYERDLNVRFSLVANNAIIFTTANPGIFEGITSHYPGLLDSNLTLFNTINSADYDLGHVFSKIGGGVAYNPSICNDRLKAGASSGIQNYPNEYFITTVAHEIGHQFNAGHTHSSTTGSCGSNYSQTDSWEIAGGSGIMSYTFACAPLVYTYSSYQYFNAGSIRKMQARIASADCNNVGAVTTSPTNLYAPEISNTVSNYIIPINTPFKLNIDATDRDGDILTYAFDQYDAIATGMATYPRGTETLGPLFKHMLPQASNERRFPSLTNLANGNVNSFEILPKVARTLNFIGFVRDNHDESGRTAEHNFRLSVDANCDSFAFTNLLLPDTLIANGTNQLTINWSTASCVYNGNINIRFSTDGGMSFPYVIVSNTANDGTETITVPNLQTNNGRFMIEASNGIIFNVNRANIVLVNSGTCLAKGTVLNNDSTVTLQRGNAALNLNLAPVYGTPVSNWTGDYTTNSVASNLAIWNQATNTCLGLSSNNLSKVIFEGYVNQSDSFTFRFSAASYDQVINVYRASFDNNNVCNNLLLSSGVYNAPYVNLTNSVKVHLETGIKYYVVVQTFDNSVPNTTSYTVAYSSPTNGVLYQGAMPNPGASYNYGYVIVNALNNTIQKITTTPDLRNASEFAAGTYNIYGISTNSAISSLNTSYQNINYQTLFQDVIFQNNNLCAEIATNSKTVNIIVPLNIKDLNFNGTLVNNNGNIYWNAIESNDLISYTLEKSENATDFNAITTILKTAAQKEHSKQYYHYTDYNVNTKSYYRLKMNYLDKKTEYSKIISLQPLVETPNVSIFPNPIRNNTQLSIHTNNKEKQQVTVVVVNALGKTLATYQIETSHANETIKIPIVNYTPGLYNIGIIQNNITTYHKLTIIQ